MTLNPQTSADNHSLQSPGLLSQRLLLQRDDVHLSVQRTWSKRECTLDEEVLLVHGAAHTHHTFDKVIRELSDPYTITTYDLRGHGCSGRTVNREYSHRQFVDDMAAVICHISPDKPMAIIASSISALHAIQLATEQPKLISHVIAVDLLPTISDATINRLRKFFSFKDFRSFEDVVDKIGFLYRGRAKGEIADELQYSVVESTPGCWNFIHDPHIIDIVHPLHLSKFKEFVPQLTTPITLLSGEQSGVITPEGIRDFRENLRNKELFYNVTIPNAAHCPWADNHLEFLKITRAALRMTI